jgi:Tol biopolymer transport system component
MEAQRSKGVGGMTIRRGLLVIGIAGAVVTATTGPAAASHGAATSRVSVSSAGAQADDGSVGPAISANGRYVAFVSYASNLVDGDTNGVPDVFVRDRRAGTTSRVSVSNTGVEANGPSVISYKPAISADGRYVAFESSASNLVPGDTNGRFDVFVRDRRAGTTSRVSVSDTGAEANGDSFNASVSADGRYVAFVSTASNLVHGDTNGRFDVFVRDRRAGTTSRVSMTDTGAEGNADSFNASVSADGRYVGFVSYASNLVLGDTNGVPDVFVHDRRAHLTSRVNVSSTGAQAQGETLFGPINVAISANGRYVTFNSAASNLVPGDTNGARDVFVRDRRAGTTSRVSVSDTGAEANGDSFEPAISADGRYVAFDSFASNLVPGGSSGLGDVFVRDRRAGTTSRVSVSDTGAEANGQSFEPAISANGRYVAFYSSASNLVPGDTNGVYDIFIRSRSD